VLEHAVKAINGKVEDKTAQQGPARGEGPNTLRGPVSFDEFGQRHRQYLHPKVEKKDGKYVNTVVKTVSRREPVLDLQTG